ncbi:uncharacterized protein V1516DRAFT_681435 [Lipomyces oligophaga]|uniref:uncharacterized protein n=1 Tax=Lipomyces oligophaga TaxID=45792 RepID=UPI0034CD0562
MENPVVLGKRKLRSFVGEKLRFLPYQAIVDQSTLITEKIRKLPEYQSANSVGLYMHMTISENIPRKSGRNVEVQTDRLIQAAFEDEKLVYLPRISTRGEVSENQLELFQRAQLSDFVGSVNPIESSFKPQSFLRMIAVQNYSSLASLDDQNSYSIKEPEHGHDALDRTGLDLIIVPGLVFNASGDRIGRGKGYYDNFIEVHRLWSRTNNRPVPKLVGICFNEQVLNPNDYKTFPVESHDRRLDLIVTANNIYRSSKQRDDLQF